MPFTLSMPKLSPTMETGVIARWCKKEGDQVSVGETILEITTDKATLEHNALDEGFLRKTLVSEGDTVKIGQAIAIFTSDADESIEGYQPDGHKAPNSEEEPKKESSQDRGADQEKTQGESSQEPTRVSMEQPAFEPEPPLENYHFPFQLESQSQKVLASPLARKIARENNLDLSGIKGSGPNGRIMKNDLDLASKRSIAGFGAEELPKLPSGSFKEVPISAVQSVVANRLQASKTFIPHFYLQQKVDFTSVIQLRKQLPVHNQKVSFNDFIVRAAALALREHPKINSGFNSKKQTLIRFKTIDISIAVSLDEGLITPIIRHADYKNLGQISSEVKVLAKKARENKLAMNEFKGGSFTISNLGMYGTSSVFPVINPPQAAILGVGGIDKVPVFQDEKWMTGHQMTLVLAADHRAVNGEDGALFLKTLKELLESPAILLI